MRKTKDGEAIAFFKKAMTHTGDDCLIWPYQKSGSGYAQMRFEHGQSVCRRVCEGIHGPAPTALHQAAHSCGNGKRGCVTPKHLKWKTPKENAADMVVHGTVLAGEKNPWAKLDAVQVHSIRTLYGMLGQTQQEIADQFGVNQRHVSKIVNRQIWGHVA
jgi:hypothetical protein